MRVLNLADFFERASRLKGARLARGFKTARAAAIYIGVPYGTYSGHENGSRGIKDAELHHYAKIFRVSPAWLAFGQEKSLNRIRLEGLVSGLNTMEQGVRRKTFPREIEPPFPVPDGVTALLVSTSDYAPTLVADDLILIGPKSKGSEVLNQRVAFSHGGSILLGTVLTTVSAQICHIQLLNGRILLDIRPEWIKRIVSVVFAEPRA